jgi:hypothetical protein
MSAATVFLGLPVFLALVVYAVCKSTHWGGLPETAGRVPAGRGVATHRFSSVGISLDRGTFVWLRGGVTVALDEQGLFLRPVFPLLVLMRPVCLAWKFMDAYEDGKQMGVRRVVVHALGERYRIALLGAVAASFADRAAASGLPPYQPKVWERPARKPSG